MPDYTERVFYTSSPGSMLDAISAMLREMDLPEIQTKFEYFTIATFQVNVQHISRNCCGKDHE